MSNNRNLGGFAEYAGAGQTAPAVSLPNIGEISTVSATAATGTINYDVLTQSTLYYTSNATADFTLNLRGNGSTTMATFLPVGQAVDVRFFNTNGAIAYKLSAIQIDGASVTPNWAGGAAPSSGTANAVDQYNVTVIRLS
jgi:hypothetical protein